MPKHFFTVIRVSAFIVCYVCVIRFIQKNEDGSLVYKSGGGITSDSNLDSEYQEMINKVYIP